MLNWQLNCSRSTIQRIISKWRETGNVRNRQHVRMRTARTRRNIAAVQEELSKDLVNRSPKKTPKRIGQRLQISKSSVARIIKFDLNLHPFKKIKVQQLTLNHKYNRLNRCQSLIQRFTDAAVKKILFTDETMFTLAGVYNAQNTRVYAASRREVSAREILFQKDSNNFKIMVWCFI